MPPKHPATEPSPCSGQLGPLFAGLFAGLLALSGCTEVVASELDENQANRVLIALDTNGVNAVKHPSNVGTDETRWTIKVPSTETVQALRALESRGLPQQPPIDIKPLIEQRSMVPSNTEEQARWSRVASAELATTLRSMEGVLDARVHLAWLTQNPWDLQKAASQPRASVLIRHFANAPPVPERDVKQLISGAIQDLAPDQVRVVFQTTTAPHDAPSRFTKVGPFSVERRSAALLRWTGVALLLLVSLVALLALVPVVRRRSQPPTDTLS